MTMMRLEVIVKYRPSRGELICIALEKFGVLLAPDVADALMDTERDPESILRYALERMRARPFVLTIKDLKGVL
jgi:hypothetical protein